MSRLTDCTCSRARHFDLFDPVSTQYRTFPCLCNIERFDFSAWVHFAFAAAVAARRTTGSAANGARREADRERRTVRGHWLRPPLAEQFRAIPGRSEQGSIDWAAGAAVQAAVSGCATLAHPRPTERPYRHLICDQDAPSMRLGRSSSVCSARASGAALFDRTNAPRARQPGAAWGRRADRSRPGRVGRGGPGRSRRAGGERACRPRLPALRRTNFVGDVWA